MRRTVEQLRQSRLARSEAAQASLEFALTITMTLLLIFGMIDFSRAIYAASIIQWAAQHGARAAIIDPTLDEVREVVEAKLVGLDLEQVVIEMDPPPWPDNVVIVTVVYSFDFIAPIVKQITGPGIEMRSSASMIAH